ncbi:MAG: butyrate kinase [Clostridiales bacterium]|jgi:butyrate kinase|nr:butyrate kinase [Clostridiales bacterium]
MSEKIYNIIAINPGSTSTKVGYYHNCEKVFIDNVQHSKDDMAQFHTVQDQYDFRRDVIFEVCEAHSVDIASIDAFVGRGGGLVPCLGGIYEINDILVEDCKKAAAGVPHPANLSPQICKELADKYNVPSYTVNSPDSDELNDIARVSGLKGLYRMSHCHALNQKEVAHRFCVSKGLKYDDVNLLLVHCGGGASITVHHNGRMIDTSDSLIGDGPMTSTRSGILPNATVMSMAYSGEYPDLQSLENKLIRNGGLIDHLGTSDIAEVVRRIEEENDEYAKLILDGMIYQIAKTIGEYSIVLKGKFEAILLTGGAACSKYVTDRLTEYVDWIAPVYIYPGQLEVAALAAGAYRALEGLEEVKQYNGVPIFKGFHSERYGL